MNVSIMNSRLRSVNTAHGSQIHATRKRGVERVSEPVLRKRKEHLSNDQSTPLPRAAMEIPAIPEGSKPLARAKRQHILRWIMSRGGTTG